MKKTLIFGALIVLVGIGGYFAVNAVNAQTSSSDLTGWAWSSNIGWISFNCSNRSTCATNPPAAGKVDYKVSIASDGTLTGWAWSSNIGWIRFASNLAGMPGGAGTVNSPASLNRTTGKLTGWARACAGTSDGLCGSNNPSADGWDGWINLSGTNYASPDSSGFQGTSTKGVTMNPTTGVFSGHAWGSDVVGWIKFFTNVSSGAVTCSSCGTSGTPPALVGTCTSNAPIIGGVATVNAGDSVTFTANPDTTTGTAPYSYKWGTNATSTNAATSTIYNSSGAGPTLALGDSANGYYNGATCPNITVATAVTNPGVNLYIGRSADPGILKTTSTSLHQNRSFNVKWEHDSSFTSCTAVATPAWTGWNNAAVSTGNSAIVPFNTGSSPYGTTVFKITCSPDTGPSVSATVTLNIITSTVIEK